MTYLCRVDIASCPSHWGSKSCQSFHQHLKRSNRGNTKSFILKLLIFFKNKFCALRLKCFRIHYQREICGKLNRRLLFNYHSQILHVYKNFGYFLLYLSIIFVLILNNRSMRKGLLTAVCAVMWVQPMILAPLSGLSFSARLLRAIRPGISKKKKQMKQN